MAWKYTEEALNEQYSTATPGTYPCHAGEYCGNHHPESYRTHGPMYSFAASLDPILRQREREQANEHLALMRFGLPHACGAGDTAKMQADGYVGLYLRADSQFKREQIEYVPTPPELMEPGFESLYNLDGKPGRHS